MTELQNVSQIVIDGETRNICDAVTRESIEAVTTQIQSILEGHNKTERVNTVLSQDDYEDLGTYFTDIETLLNDWNTYISYIKDAQNYDNEDVTSNDELREKYGNIKTRLNNLQSVIDKINNDLYDTTTTNNLRDRIDTCLNEHKAMRQEIQNWEALKYQVIQNAACVGETYSKELIFPSQQDFFDLVTKKDTEGNTILKKQDDITHSNVYSTGSTAISNTFYSKAKILAGIDSSTSSTEAGTSVTYNEMTDFETEYLSNISAENLTFWFISRAAQVYLAKPFTDYDYLDIVCCTNDTGQGYSGGNEPNADAQVSDFTVRVHNPRLGNKIITHISVTGDSDIIWTKTKQYQFGKGGSNKNYTIGNVVYNKSNDTYYTSYDDAKSATGSADGIYYCNRLIDTYRITDGNGQTTSVGEVGQGISNKWNYNPKDNGANTNKADIIGIVAVYGYKKIDTSLTSEIINKIDNQITNTKFIQNSQTLVKATEELNKTRSAMNAAEKAQNEISDTTSEEYQTAETNYNTAKAAYDAAFEAWQTAQEEYEGILKLLK